MGYRQVAYATLLVSLGIIGAGGGARAEYKLEKSETHWISLGFGLRVEAAVSEGVGSTEWDHDFALDNARLYINGRIHEAISFEVNADYDSTTDDLHLADGIIKVKLSDLFQLWGGRLLPPSDRNNLSGAYFLNAWSFPGIAHRYGAIYGGRDNGVAVWGQVGEGQFKYQLGVFEGFGGSSPRFAGRVVVNFLDPEPGYYNSSTSHGDKDVFAIGGVVQYEDNRFGSGLDRLDGNVDVLFEKNFGESSGTLTLDGHVYFWDSDKASDALASDGISYSALAAFLIPQEIGGETLSGRLQPYVRYQRFSNDVGADPDQIDAGLNWIIDGHNARLSLDYSHFSSGTGASEGNAIKAGIQIQF